MVGDRQITNQKGNGGGRFTGSWWHGHSQFCGTDSASSPSARTIALRFERIIDS
jgi:hypothetical protein